MNTAANVTTSQSLLDFRAALTVFADQGKNALSAVDLDIRRLEDWLASQLTHWHTLKRQTEDDIIRAKNELARRKMMRVGDRIPDCSEQEKALNRLRAQFDTIEDKIAATRAWQRAFPETVTEYQGPSRQLMFTLETDIPRMRNYLDHKIEALDAYVHQAPAQK